jgi:5-methylcytosine-specific restriction protein A
MPMRPPHPCNHQGCQRLARARYCPEHARQAEQDYQRQRGTAAERGYTSTWAKVRRMKLARAPLCERCQEQGRDVAAVLVHHRDRNARNNTAENLQCVCDACHDAIHQDERWTGRRGGD